MGKNLPNHQKLRNRNELQAKKRVRACAPTPDPQDRLKQNGKLKRRILLASHRQPEKEKIQLTSGSHQTEQSKKVEPLTGEEESR